MNNQTQTCFRYEIPLPDGKCDLRQSPMDYKFVVAWRYGALGKWHTNFHVCEDAAILMRDDFISRGSETQIIIINKEMKS